ncbi:hypothetical protein BC831DRAFT_550918 [Entophlyctis helioformis]|nr:hypothetical protein BC831DRAFT_550918 [Entophlyctis helioformis]
MVHTSLRLYIYPSARFSFLCLDVIGDVNAPTLVCTAAVAAANARPEPGRAQVLGALAGRAAATTAVLAQADKELDVGVAASDVEALYEALNAPIQPLPAALAGPASTAAFKLLPDYIHSLQLSFADTSSDRQADLDRRRADLAAQLAAPGAASPTLEQLSQLIHINALVGRPSEALEAFNHIPSVGLKPDAVAFNHLMDAYARSANLEAAVAVFAQLQAAGIPPDLVSYSTLIKACVAANDLNAAFKLYRDMKDQGLQPNHIVFTTLIKGCIKAGDTARAWKTFNFMRTEIAAPDAVAFNLMIHACARTQDAERAMDLFQEMAERGLQATQITFTSLIQACVSRKDYYNDAFALLEQMAAEGFEPSMYTYNVLLAGAAQHGDVVRGRMVWNDLVKRMHEQPPLEADEIGVGRIEPDESSFAAMLRLYGFALKLHKQGAYRVLDQPAATTTSPPAAAEAEQPTPATEPAAAPTSHTQLISVPDDTVYDYPLLTSPLLTPDAFMRDVDTLWSLIQTRDKLAALRTSPRLLIAYLRILCLSPRSARRNITHKGILDRALAFWESSKPVMGPSMATFIPLLELAMRRPETVEQGTKLWRELLEWDASREAEIQRLSSGGVSAETAAQNQAAVTPGERDEKDMQVERLSRQEMEQLREREGRSRDTMLKAFLIMARGYSAAGKDDLAVRTLFDTTNFRYPYYLPAVHFADIPTITSKAKALADSGHWTLMSELATLCPPSTDPLSQVQHLLKMKTVPVGSWWGWQVLGVEKHDMEVLRRRQRKERERSVQRADAYRDRAKPGKNGQPRRRHDGDADEDGEESGKAAGDQRKREKRPQKKAIVPKFVVKGSLDDLELEPSAPVASPAAISAVEVGVAPPAPVSATESPSSAPASSSGGGRRRKSRSAASDTPE